MELDGLLNTWVTDEIMSASHGVVETFTFALFVAGFLLDLRNDPNTPWSVLLTIR
jgi:hypothetical protein